MSRDTLDIVVLGLSITSSWGNGHATTFRGLVRELVARGHRVLFLERDVPWYASNRDLPRPPYGETELYGSLEELQDRFAARVRGADAVIVGSYVPDGIEVGDWVQRTAEGVTAFYDIDTPVTLAALERADCAYLAGRQIAGYDLYLSFTGGPTLARIARTYGAPLVRPLYCSVDPALYYPDGTPERYRLGYIGTYSPDRQPTLDALLIEPARRLPELRFAVAGPMYPPEIGWPSNVERIEHLPPDAHRSFYNAQRVTLNVTRADMIAAGWSPSVRLFEAAACGTPIMSDWWQGLGEFFAIGEEILVARGTEEAVSLLTRNDTDRMQAVGEAARRAVLARHTAAHRAEELERYLMEARDRNAAPGRRAVEAGA